ncbi:uncharacterized protein LOC133876128 [Alnus glutinosa]|uniref:uncharacterized protein LOC133876128 n=1 Tax=Alnus glutinosa TaxID=3517 RepID=UPI002D779705|nr:uncharacterized protein LOC133876128 [Alnus glutinosa]
MENWWGKFVGEEPHASTGHEDGEEYYDSEELMSLDGSDDELTERRRRRYREFNENHDMRVPIVLEKGLLFADTCVFKKALKWVRVSAVCKEQGEGCELRIHASLDAKKESIQIKTFRLDHQCGNQYENTMVDVQFLATKYMPDFKDDPTWTLYALQQRVKRDHNIDVPVGRCWREKKVALKAIYGSHSEQYRHARKYCEAILRSNPNSSAYVKIERSCFQRLYICLDACNKGFKYGCRPIVCLDACHLKGEVGDQLLCTIGKDGNDDMFPIAYVVAEGETRASWEWFLGLLIDDVYVGSGEGRGWTVMSDRQKGLGPTVDHLLPHAEH